VAPQLRTTVTLTARLAIFCKFKIMGRSGDPVKSQMSLMRDSSVTGPIRRSRPGSWGQRVRIAEDEPHHRSRWKTSGTWMYQFLLSGRVRRHRNHGCERSAVVTFHICSEQAIRHTEGHNGRTALPFPPGRSGP
jgi:hypothetical protein